MENLIRYDEGDDSLTIISGKRDAKYSINTGQMLISINSKKQVSGIEVFGVHKNFKISKDVLKKLSKAKINVLPNKKEVTLNILLKPGVKISSKFTIDVLLQKDSFNAIAS